MELRQLEARADAVRTVVRVVKAVWAIARAQLPLADRAAAEASRHVDELDAVLDRIAGAPLAQATTATALYVVFGPENALSGGLVERLRRALPPAVALGVIGTRMFNLLAMGPEAGRVEFHLRGPTSPGGLDTAARALAAAIIGEGGAIARGREVRLLHPVADRDEPVVKILLSGPREAAPMPPETLSPLREVVAEVAAQALAARLTAALAESLRCEIKARLETATQARRSAEERLDLIERAARAERQGEVTREVQELAGARLAREHPEGR